jgi:OOP family OmpA-OmpF porin
MKMRFLMVAGLAAGLSACAHHAPPPPPPPPPPPQVEVHWDHVVLYFDFMKANLTSAAANAIADAISHHGHPPHHVILTGYCDSAEHHCHDLGLRRADAVKDELVRRGMPAGDIETHASDDLAVPTPHHTREPQNRRVVIDPS